MSKHRPTFPAVAHILLQRSSTAPAAQGGPGVAAQGGPGVGAGGGELLLLRRAGSGFMDGVYSLPGGHLEPGELPLAAAVRECTEEVGVTPLGLTPICVLPYLSGQPGTRQHQGFNFVFAAKRWEGRLRLAEPDGADVLCWQNPAYLPQLCVPWLTQVLAATQAGPWYQELSYS